MGEDKTVTFLPLQHLSFSHHGHATPLHVKIIHTTAYNQQQHNNNAWKGERGRGRRGSLQHLPALGVDGEIPPPHPNQVIIIIIIFLLCTAALGLMPAHHQSWPAGILTFRGNFPFLTEGETSLRRPSLWGWNPERRKEGERKQW